MVQIHSVSFVLKSDLFEGISECSAEYIQDHCIDDFTWGDTAHSMITLGELREALGCDGGVYPEMEEDTIDQEDIIKIYTRLYDLHKACGDLLMVDLAR